MSSDNPTVRERLAKLEEKVDGLGRYVRNDLAHRLLRVELALYALVLGGAGALLAYLLRS